MKRLVAGIAILIVTLLDFRFGRSGTVMHVAGLTAALLLVLSVAVDRRLGIAASPVASRADQAAEPLDGEAE